MWTHLQPHVDETLTADSIQRHARLSIYRAINMGRIVAMAGSGITRAYGLPSWDSLGAFLVHATAHEIDRVADSNQGIQALEAIRPLIEQLKVTCQTPDSDPEHRDSATDEEDWWVISLTPDRAKKLNTQTLMELCESVLDRLPDDEVQGYSRRWAARRELSRRLRNGEEKQTRARLKDLFAKDTQISHSTSDARILNDVVTDLKNRGYESSAELIRGAIDFEWDEPSRALDYPTLLYEIARGKISPQEAYDSTSHSPSSDTGRQASFGPMVRKFGSDGGLEDRDAERDPVDAIYNTLGASRVLTLNYDVQFERAVRRKLHSSGGDSSAAFDTLCHENSSERDDPKRVAVETGLRRAVLSATLDASNVGELISFASFSRSYDSQIFHLHGRLDDPDNMVLTQRDYQRVYLGDEAAEKAFLEAQEVMFGGNDILFVGVGMNEDDVMRPFRRFVSRGIAPDQAPRNVLALMGRSTASDGATEDRFRVIRNAVNFDAYTLLFGGKRFKKSMRSLDHIGTLITSIDSLKDQFDSAIKDDNDEYASPGLSRHWRRFSDQFRDLESWSGDLDTTNFEDTFEGEKLKKYAKQFWEKSERFSLRENVRRLQKESKKKRSLLSEEEVSALAEILGSKQFVGTSASERKRGLTDDNCRKAALALVDELKSRVHSRALVNELQDLSMEAGKWWDAWRQFPAERRGLYTKGSVQDQTGNVYVRHAPVYPRIGQHLKQGHFWSPLESFRKSAQELFAKDAGDDSSKGDETKSKKCSSELRILRQCIPRGGGKGSVVSLLMLQQNRDRIFPSFGSNEADSYQEYESAFIAHLSFSLEFNSLFLALARFFARRIGELAERSPQELEEIEDTPTMALDTGEWVQSRDGSSRQPHRLELLQRLVQRYTDVAKEKDDRVFICLSGLDRLCDESGDGHNPMHRAFFRLITNFDEIFDPAPPIDLLLIAGRPETPIAYLSEEEEPRDIDKAGKTRAGRNFGYDSKRGVPLLRWQIPARFTLAERALLTPFAADLEISEIQSAIEAPVWSSDEVGPKKFIVGFARAILREDPNRSSHSELNTSPKVNLFRLLQDNSALTGIAMTAVANLEYEGKALEEFLAKLDRAAARHGRAGVLDVVLTEYSRTDQSEDSYTDAPLIDAILRHLALFSLPIEPWVMLGCPMILKRLREVITARNQERELRDIVDDKTRTGSSSKENGRLNQSVSEARVLREWTERFRMMSILREHLTILKQRSFVIEVDVPDLSGSKEFTEDELFLHRRFSVHARVREHLAAKMRLSVIDDGDSNHHQLSIFCDQPRDLPTPSANHYELIRGILNLSIRRCRETLECFYRLTPNDDHPDLRFSSWDEDEDGSKGKGKGATYADDPIAKRMASILYTPHESAFDSPSEVDLGIANSDGLAGSMGRIHAVSQRLRGCYSLIRGSFSVGVISRLDELKPEDADETPFETYRLWLRALTNASVGIRVHGEAIREVIAKDIFAGAAAKEYKSLQGRPFVIAKGAAKRVRKRREKLKLREKQESNLFSHIRHPHYRDETAWLYNERGLTSLIQGRIYDAIPAFEQARLGVSHAEAPDFDPHAYHAAERRIVLNTAIARIECGNISQARSDLEWLLRGSYQINGSTPDPMKDFAVGYIALCDHLSGSLTRAEAGYREALDFFVKNRRLRAVSIFNRHLADLALAQRKPEAEEYARLSINAASQAEQRDVQHLALVCEAKIFIYNDDRRKDAMERINRAIDYSNRMGLYRLRVDAQLAHARLMLINGEIGLAGSAAAQAAALSIRHGLRLRKLSSLAIYSEVQIARDKHDIALGILSESKAEAERLGYQTQAAAISDQIAKIAIRHGITERPYGAGV